MNKIKLFVAYPGDVAEHREQADKRLNYLQKSHAIFTTMAQNQTIALEDKKVLEALTKVLDELGGLPP